jgi:hypothetical protein
MIILLFIWTKDILRSAFLTVDKTKVPLLTGLAFCTLYRLTN